MENNTVGAIHFRYIYNEREANALFNRLEDSISSADKDIQTQIRSLRSHASRLQVADKNAILPVLNSQKIDL